MPLTKQATTVENAGLRVQWPEFPELDGLKAEEEAALREWYFRLRQSVDRTLAAIIAEVKNAAS